MLLANKEQLLPLNFSKAMRLAVVGDADTVKGGGSGSVWSGYIITPAQGILNRASRQTRSGPSPASGLEPLVSCQRAGVLEICNVSIASTSCGMGQCNETQDTPVVTAADIENAVSIAKQSDVTVVSVATTSTEGFDRFDLSVGAMQDRLVTAVAAVCQNVVAVSTPWAVLPSVKSIVLQLLPGQEAGNALASVLAGDISPSGKLPVTFPHNLSETWLQTTAQYPGLGKGASNETWEGMPMAPDNETQTCGGVFAWDNATVGGCQWVTTYTEGLEIGYRWYDAKDLEPAFPFGHGLACKLPCTAELLSELPVSSSFFCSKTLPTVNRHDLDLLQSERQHLVQHRLLLQCELRPA